MSLRTGLGNLVGHIADCLNAKEIAAAAETAKRRQEREEDNLRVRNKEIADTELLRQNQCIALVGLAEQVRRLVSDASCDIKADRDVYGVTTWKAIVTAKAVLVAEFHLMLGAEMIQSFYAGAEGEQIPWKFHPAIPQWIIGEIDREVNRQLEANKKAEAATPGDDGRKAIIT